MADAREISEVMNMVLAAYPAMRAKMSPDDVANTKAAWLMMLSDIPAASIRAAVIAHSRDAAKGMWMPGPADIIAALGWVRDEAEALPTALQAWQQVCASVAWNCAWEVGARDTLHPLVIAAGEAFGLERIRMRLTEDGGTNFAQFRDAYTVLCSRSRKLDDTHPAVRALLSATADAFRARLPAPAGPALLAGSVAPGLFVGKPDAVNAPDPARVAEIIRAIAGTPQKTRQQIEREAHVARLAAQLERDVAALEIETDPARRAAIQLRVDGARKAVAP